MVENREPSGSVLVPVGLEQLLYLAARDRGLRDALLADREGTLAARGLALRPTERAALLGASDAQLAAMIDRLDVSDENLERRGFLRAVAAVAVTAATGTLAASCERSPAAGEQPGDVPGAPFRGQAEPARPREEASDAGVSDGPADTGAPVPNLEITPIQAKRFSSGGARPHHLPEDPFEEPSPKKQKKKKKP